MKQSRKEFYSVVLNDTIYALGGRDNNNDRLRSCERYDSQLNEWSTVADMNSYRENASAAVINGCIYVAGGGGARSVSKYCPETDTWREVAPMTTARWNLTLTPFAGRLWAIGGRDGGHLLSSCESYDPVTDTWQKEAPMKEGRWRHTAIEFNGKLYVVGGGSYDNETKKMETTKIVEKYVPNIKKWVEDSTLQYSIENPQLLLIPPICSSFFTTDPNQ
ncbi:Kelch-like protein 10 [Tyrophagus putrescentiae]|nr:Kelch-like protein 10 [Tyrophagus putrescentiae]